MVDQAGALDAGHRADARHHLVEEGETPPRR
jgi:hypothetical protein